MASKKGSKIKFLKGEILMYIVLVGLLLAIPMFNVYTSGMLSETNTKVERLKSKIRKQESTNQSLSMQLDELVSLENIQSIAQRYGLSYNNGNIKSIGQE